MSGTLFVDTEKIRANIERIKKQTRTKFCAVVKANAYGTGTELAKHIDDVVDYYAVAGVNEANTLAQITSKSILILSPPTIEEIGQILHSNICFAVDSIAIVSKLANCSRVYNIHIAVNTGMNRFGTDYATFCKMLATIKKAKNINLLGVFSHFFSVDTTSRHQAKLFDKFAVLAKKLFPDVICHIANSQNTKYAYDMVRVGIGLYGKEQESLSLASTIREIREVKKGQAVSYNGNFVSSKDLKIAVVPIGYADGISRLMSGKYVIVRGKYCQIVGSVCMDCFMIDVSCANAQVGDRVIIFGKDKTTKINVCQIAKWCDTISYEILVRLGARIERKYLCKSSEENIKAEN